MHDGLFICSSHRRGVNFRMGVTVSEGRYLTNRKSVSGKQAHGSWHRHTFVATPLSVRLSMGRRAVGLKDGLKQKRGLASQYLTMHFRGNLRYQVPWRVIQIGI